MRSQLEIVFTPINVMNRGIKITILLFSASLLLMLIACSKIERYNEDSLILFESYIKSASFSGVSVDVTEFSTDSFTISFSDKQKKQLSFDLVAIYTIGIDGYWYVNGRKTEISLSECKERIDLLSPVNPSTQCLCSIVEDYTGWIFVFMDGSLLPLKKTLYSFDADSLMRSVNHRGYSFSAPENTLQSFRLSRLNGFRYVETDVRFTSDGVPVLLHDPTIDRTSNGIGRIDQISFEDVRKLDFGKWKASQFENTVIPSFDEFLSLCVEIGLEPNIELKCGTRDQIHEIVKMVDNYGLRGKSTYISFSLQLLQYVIEIDSTSRVGFVSSKLSEKVVSDALTLQTGFNEVYIGSADYSENGIELCKNAGLPLSVYVIDSKEQILSLPKYVSSVTSNRFHAGRVIYEARKK